MGPFARVICALLFVIFVIYMQVTLTNVRSFSPPPSCVAG